jgi:lipopolysaccharide export LptBFGC system permease protein LptF
MAASTQSGNFTQSVIQEIRNLQGIEQASALQQLQQNPGQLSNYLAQNQQAISDAIKSSKNNMFRKVYGDMGRASSTEHSFLYYKLRDKDVNTLQSRIGDTVFAQANAVVQDTDLAQRQYEINQWEAENKRETLFVYQWIFLALLVIIVMTALSINNFISPGIASGITTILLIILALILYYRWSYTTYYRNKRYWNKREQPKFAPLPTPECPSADVQGVVQRGSQIANQIAGTASGTLDFTQNLVSANMNAINNR